MEDVELKDSLVRGAAGSACYWTRSCPFLARGKAECSSCDADSMSPLNREEAEEWWKLKRLEVELGDQRPSNPNPPPEPAKKEDTFSDHYKLSAGPEDIIKMEAIADELEKHGVSAKTIAAIMTACKYYGRMGLKDGQTFEKEVTKCSNYFYRAITGKFFDSEGE